MTGEPRDPNPLDDDACAFEPALLRAAAAMTKDAAEGRKLVALALVKARAEARCGETSVQARVRLFRLLRQTYHSIERSRGHSRARDAAITALATAATGLPTARRA